MGTRGSIDGLEEDRLVQFNAFLTGVNSEVSLVEMLAPGVFVYVFVVSYIHALFKLAEVSFASLSSTNRQFLY